MDSSNTYAFATLCCKNGNTIANQAQSMAKPQHQFDGASTLDDSWPLSNRKSCLLEALQHGVDLEAAFDAYWPLPYLLSA